MDTELKEHFDNQQLFISGALAGVEKRIVTRIDDVEKGVRGLGTRLDKLDRDMDAKLNVLIELVRRR